METKRASLRLSILVTAALLLAGCGKPGDRSAPESEHHSAQSQRAAAPPPPVDHLVVARRMLLLRNWDVAADSVYKALLQDPESIEATLVASQIEAGRGNHQASADLAASIDVGSRLGKKAVGLHVDQLAALGRTSDAADVLLQALEIMPEEIDWHHRAWALLNRAGRREEASRQAEMLCRVGQANESELLSLVRRTEAFPPVFKKGEDPEPYFDAGLGMARWYFTKLDFPRALEELTTESEGELRGGAAQAFYGRLLAETQRFEQFPRWHAECNSQEVEPLGDYWAALGTYFIDQRRYEAAAKALLEAVVRNPTDRICFQRLGKVLDTLGRSEEAAEFRARAIKISDSERAAESILISGSHAKSRQLLTRQIMELGRPFETLQWTATMMPASATAERAVVARQRAELLQSRRALSMAAESSLLGLDPGEFDLQGALAELKKNSAAGVASKNKPVDVEPLARPRLVNVARPVGIDFQWYQDLEFNIASIPIHESVGGGIAVIDYDLDGWPDVYLGQGSGEPPTDRCTRSNVMMRNLDGRFSDVTGSSASEDFNYAAGIAAGDINQDGFPDLYLGSLGHNRLLLNNGDGTFRDFTDSMGSIEDRFTSSLAIADINGDSLPDLFEGIYIEMEGAFKLPDVGEDGHEVQPSPLFHFAQSDRWFENNGDGTFALREISREVAKPGTSLGVIVTDFDGDGSNEVFVGNDVRPNHFLFHSGDSQLANTADALGVANGFHGAATGCMGIASGDFNRDGRLDLHITNFSEESANLYLQRSGGGFTDLAVHYGIEAASWPYVGFGTKTNDLDRNGWLDLLVTNGHIFDMRPYGEEFQMPPQCLMGRGNRFEQVTVDDESQYWDNVYLGRSMAMIDYNRDGATDFLINHLDEPLALLENQTRTDGNFVQLELVGTASERDAIGSRVVITCGDEQWTQWVTAGDGYFCSDEPVIDLGVGTHQKIDRVEVHWPSGQPQTFIDVAPGHRYLVVEGGTELVPRLAAPQQTR